MKKHLALTAILLVTIAFSACTKTKVIDTEPILQNITQDDIERYESIIEEYGQKIQEFKSRKFTEEELKKIDEGEEITDPTTPNIDWFVEKSNAERMLGKNTEAIKTLEESLKHFKNSTVSWNNLGAIYADFGDCKNADKYYSKLVEHFGGERGANYLMYIARCHLGEGDIEKVSKTVDLFERMGGTNMDSEIAERLSAQNQ